MTMLVPMTKSGLRRLRRVAWAGVVLVGGVFSTATAVGQEIRLVTGNDYAPYTDLDLPEGGMVNEIVKRVYERLGVDYAIDWRPWRRGYEEGANGEYLATYPYVYNEERNRYYAFSEPVYTSKLRLFSLTASNMHVADLEDIRGRRICLPLGWAPAPKLAEMFAADAVLRDMPADMETCFRLLERKRTDFALANEAQGWVSASTVGLDDTAIEVSPFIFQINPLYVIFSRQAPNFETELERFNTALTGLRASGEYDEIVARHLGTPRRTRGTPPAEPESGKIN